MCVYCGPYKVLKRIGPNAYRLDFPSNVMVHPVFYVSQLKEVIGYDDNVIPPSNLWTFEHDHFSSNEPEKILDHRARNLRSKVVHRYKVKWKDRLEEDSTWETEETLANIFLTSHCKSAIKRRGGVCNVHSFRRAYLGAIIL